MMPADVSAPEKGNTYTVREIRMVGDEPAMTLVEIHNRHMWIEGPPDIFWEPCFAVWRFDPVVDRDISAEDDIALFAPILHGQPVEA